MSDKSKKDPTQLELCQASLAVLARTRDSLAGPVLTVESLRKIGLPREADKLLAYLRGTLPLLKECASAVLARMAEAEMTEYNGISAGGDDASASNPSSGSVKEPSQGKRK